MKFTRVPVGQRFGYLGETLVKVGPMTASNERGGNLRLIPRSAVVVPVDDAALRPAAPDIDLRRAQLEAALARCEAHWRTALAKLEPGAREPLEAELASAQLELRAALGLDGTTRA